MMIMGSLHGDESEDDDTDNQETLSYVVNCRIQSKFERIRWILKHTLHAFYKGFLTKFLVNPYYEPLSWFMILINFL